MTTTTHDDVNAFLNQSGAPSAKFASIGTTVKGTVIAAEVRDQTDFTTGEVLRWDNGDPRKQLVVTLQTDERDGDINDDDGTRRLFAKGNMLNAIKAAVRKAGANLEPGGTLVVKYVADGDPPKKGLNAPKLYEAAYKPGTQTDVDSLLGDSSPAPSELL